MDLYLDTNDNMTLGLEVRLFLVYIKSSKLVIDRKLYVGSYEDKINDNIRNRTFIFKRNETK